MRLKVIAALVVSLWSMTPPPARGVDVAQPVIDRPPPQLETRFALSALPPTLRAHASVYLLDPSQGYELAREGTSGVTCIVKRTVWEKADFRNDVYVPLCYDAAGTTTYLAARGSLRAASTL